MKTILLVTTNKRKVGEARLACDLYDIQVNNESYDIDEIQSPDPRKVSEHKAREAYKHAKQPVVVTDSFWHIPALNGFPGPYMKDVSGWFSEEDFVNLVAHKDDKRISFSENIAYFDGTLLKQFSMDFWGTIVAPRGNGMSIENVAEFNGKTLGEHRDEGGFGYKAEDYVWIEFAKWYSKR